MPADFTKAAASSAESACRSGLELLSRGDFAAADREFETAISMAPSMAQAHLGLGNSLRRQRKLRDAESALRRARTLDPNLRDATYSLAFLLHSAGRDSETAATLRELAAREPADLTLQRQVTGLLMDFNCFEDAARLARKIAEAAPAAGAWQRLGVCLLQSQRLPEAEEALNAAVRSDPLAGFAYLLMSQTRRATRADRARLDDLQAILDNSKITGEARACLHFAMGNWLEDLGDFKGAWQQFSAANRLRRDARAFDRLAWEDYFKGLPKTVEHADRIPISGPNPQPLFLIGFPGANPELLASLLATHPAVSSLGVSTQVDGLARACEQLVDKAYPDCLADIEVAQLDGLEQGARADWPEKTKEARWVLDETPLNFLHLALIQRVYPDSRIIHQHRQPWDDCLSAYLWPFPHPNHGHVHDLQDLAYFYRQYSALMDRWQECLPAQTLLKFQANSRVNTPATDAQAVWKFLGLNVAPAAETRHPASRPLLSADPQRRDIPGRWRNYREYLAPVFEAAGLEPD
ncbi:MAG: sulfotransferase [Gammaproteobacteria bacterium]|nr:sulfotransferase [Gammaproteobacteria bacterium]